jgi:hypothetical protein
MNPSIREFLPYTVPGALAAQQALAKLEQAGARIVDVISDTSPSWQVACRFKVKYCGHAWLGFAGAGEAVDASAGLVNCVVNVYTPDNRPWPEASHPVPWIPLWCSMYYKGLEVPHADADRDDIDLLGWVMNHPAKEAA